MKSNRLIPTLSITSGILLALGGFSLIALYIYTAVQALGQPDQSLLFWYLPLVFFGILLNSAGAYFIDIGIKASRNPAVHKLTRNSLIVLGGSVILTLALFWIGEYRADQTREDLKQQQELIANLHNIVEVGFNNITDQGFSIFIKSVGSLDGEYRIKISFSDFRDQLYQFNNTVSLNSGESENEFVFSFDDIFRICGSSNSSTVSYFCVENTGTSNHELEISVSLEPIDIEGIDNSFTGVISSWKSSLFLDTVNQNGVVLVKSVKPDSITR